MMSKLEIYGTHLPDLMECLVYKYPQVSNVKRIASDNIYCEKEEGYYSDEDQYQYQYQDPFAEHDTNDLERITSRLNDCIFQAMAVYIQIEKSDFEIHQEPLYDVADIVVKSKQ